MKNQNYQEKLELYNDRIKSTLESICISQGGKVSEDDLNSIQKVIMLVNERDKIGRNEMTEIFSDALNQTRKEFPGGIPSE